MAYKITINKEDLRTEAQKGIEAVSEMLGVRNGTYDVFGKFKDGKLVDVANVPLRTIPVVKLDGGALVNDADLPNGWAAQTAIYLGTVRSDPQS